MKKRKALLMGFGLQGHGALYDLLKFGNFEEVRVFDNRPDLNDELKKYSSGDTKITPIAGLATDKAIIEKAMQGVDIAICLLPRSFALPMAELAVEVGVNYACASYMGAFCSDDESRIRQAQRLDNLRKAAAAKNIVVLTQCGLDPGLDLLLAGEAVRQFDKVDDFISYGAGFPDRKAAENPLQYKFTWTIEGVIRSYNRPARIISNGAMVDIAPNEIFFDKNIHTLSIDELGGKLECFPNGDAAVLAEELGIKDQVKSMGRYVCRWEGHCAFWRVMSNCGLLNDESVNVKGTQVNKIAYLTALLSSE
ncbi:MAG: saccharopine dehydrogenase C-terminal domain-containing protein, partial [Synergistaceae bacterium]|nr:saccharopine dehydrogenase C-terminal domain-containing protein [Synergistaceae bacterium]